MHTATTNAQHIATASGRPQTVPLTEVKDHEITHALTHTDRHTRTCTHIHAVDKGKFNLYIHTQKDCHILWSTMSKHFH